MTKFTTENKLAAVQRYLEGKDSYRSIGEIIGTSDTEIDYRYNGVKIIWREAIFITNVGFI